MSRCALGEWEKSLEPGCPGISKKILYRGQQHIRHIPTDRVEGHTGSKRNARDWHNRVKRRGRVPINLGVYRRCIICIQRNAAAVSRRQR